MQVGDRWSKEEGKWPVGCAVERLAGEVVSWPAANRGGYWGKSSSGHWNCEQQVAADNEEEEMAVDCCSEGVAAGLGMVAGLGGVAKSRCRGIVGWAECKEEEWPGLSKGMMAAS